MAFAAYTVPLSKVVAQGVRVELPEAIAILDATWAVVSSTRDAEGRYRPLPTADECLLTASATWRYSGQLHQWQPRGWQPM